MSQTGSHPRCSETNNLVSSQAQRGIGRKSGFVGRGGEMNVREREKERERERERERDRQTDRQTDRH